MFDELLQNDPKVLRVRRAAGHLFGDYEESRDLIL